MPARKPVQAPPMPQLPPGTFCAGRAIDAAGDAPISRGEQGAACGAKATICQAGGTPARKKAEE
jgi:hypothetical protein